MLQIYRYCNNTHIYFLCLTFSELKTRIIREEICKLYNYVYLNVSIDIDWRKQSPLWLYYSFVCPSIFRLFKTSAPIGAWKWDPRPFRILGQTDKSTERPTDRRRTDKVIGKIYKKFLSTHLCIWLASLDR